MPSVYEDNLTVKDVVGQLDGISQVFRMAFHAFDEVDRQLDVLIAKEPWPRIRMMRNRAQGMDRMARRLHSEIKALTGSIRSEADLLRARRRTERFYLGSDEWKEHLMDFGRSDWNENKEALINGDGPIPPNEPVFLIRAQDVAGPHAIDAWVKTMRSLGAPPHIIDSALSTANAMRNWPLRKLASMPKPRDPQLGLFDGDLVDHEEIAEAAKREGIQIRLDGEPGLRPKAELVEALVATGNYEYVEHEGESVRIRKATPVGAN